VALDTLKKRREFLWVRGGRRWSAPAFVLEARPREPAVADAPARFGFTVSKKVGGAVERNKVRRRLRAIASALQPEQTQAGFDYVLIARPSAMERRFADLKSDLDTALVRVHQAPGQKRRGARNS